MTFAAPAPGQVGVAYSTTLDGHRRHRAAHLVDRGGQPPAGSDPERRHRRALRARPTTAGSSAFTVGGGRRVRQDGDARRSRWSIAAGPLVITKTANVSSAVAGGTVGYTITVTNTGTVGLHRRPLSDPLAGVLDDATYNANATATSGTLSYTARR